MQMESKAQFLRYHQGSVIGVAFHPKDRYLFCSGAYDGKVNLYSAQRYEFLQSYTLTSVGLARNINAVRFSGDGAKILATTTARRLSVIDLVKGEQVLTYDNCAFNGRDRTGLAADPSNPNIAACCCVNGKGLTLFDLRMQLPLDFLFDMHSGIIRDIAFLDGSWPWCRGEKMLVTVAEDGFAKVTSLDGRHLHTVDVEQPMYSVAVTPEMYNSGVDDGFSSLLVFGGDHVASYMPETDFGIRETLEHNKEAPVWKLRYTAHGSMLYIASDQGFVHRYRRYPDRHGYLGEVFRHKSEVADMDISPYDEYLVTASKDRSVGVLQLGGPNHGASEYSELT